MKLLASRNFSRDETFYPPVIHFPTSFPPVTHNISTSCPQSPALIHAIHTLSTRLTGYPLIHTPPRWVFHRLSTRFPLDHLFDPLKMCIQFARFRASCATTHPLQPQIVRQQTHPRGIFRLFAGGALPPSILAQKIPTLLAFARLRQGIANA